MAKDTTGQDNDASPQLPRRKPVTIDLPAEEVARKAEAPGSSDAFAWKGDVPPDDPPPLEDELGPPEPEAAQPAKSESDRTTDDDGAARSERRGQFLPLLAAGLVGGAVAALAVILLARAGYLAPDDGALRDEVSALRSDVTALRQADADNAVAPLQDEIAALRQSLGEIAPREPTGAADAAALRTIETRVTELERLAKSGVGVGGAAALDSRISELAGEVAALKASSATPPDVEPSIEALRNTVNEFSARLDALPTEERIAAIETRVGALSGQIESTAALGPAVAAEALNASLVAGQPFATELAALRSLGVDAEAVEGLAPYAESGLPTIAALRTTFDDAIASIDLSMPVAEGTGAMQRLLQSARSLVEVRPAHPTAGADPAAVVARIRGALVDEDLKTALAEWSALPESVKTATGDWAQTAQSRLDAEMLVARLRTEALSRLKPAE